METKEKILISELQYIKVYAEAARKMMNKINNDLDSAIIKKKDLKVLLEKRDIIINDFFTSIINCKQGMIEANNGIDNTQEDEYKLVSLLRFQIRSYKKEFSELEYSYNRRRLEKSKIEIVRRIQVWFNWVIRGHIDPIKREKESASYFKKSVQDLNQQINAYFGVQQ